MSLWIKCLLIFGLFFCTVYADIVVNGIIQTEPAILGSNTTALQCDYDSGNETGVEVKWFFDHHIQIFSWIPFLNEPQAMGRFRQILDVDNTTLRFKNITRNLTGVYSCKVTGDRTEDIKSKMMIAHQPPTETTFFLEEASDALICACTEAFPLPVLTIQRSNHASSNKKTAAEKPRSFKTESDDDLFNVSTMWRMNKTEISETTEFVCNIHIPGTPYNETLIYVHNVTSNETITSTSSENSTNFRSTKIVLISTTIKPNSPDLASNLKMSTGLIVTLAILTTCRS